MLYVTYQDFWSACNDVAFLIFSEIVCFGSLFLLFWGLVSGCSLSGCTEVVDCFDLLDNFVLQM